MIDLMILESLGFSYFCFKSVYIWVITIQKIRQMFVIPLKDLRFSCHSLNMIKKINSKIVSLFWLKKHHEI